MVWLGQKGLWPIDVWIEVCGGTSKESSSVSQIFGLLPCQRPVAHWHWVEDAMPSFNLE